MRKILFLGFLLISFLSFGQTQYAPMGSPFGNTLSALGGLKAFQLPRGADTSLNGKLDSVGMLFYRTSDTALWMRVPKVSGVGNYWKKIASGTSTLSNYFVKGGNSFGTIAKLGTNDNYDLEFETNGVSNVVLSSDGSFYSPTQSWSFNTDGGFQLGSNAGFSPNGDLKIPHSRYMNFAQNDGQTGVNGFGFRDSAGVVMFKDSLGTWKRLASGGVSDTAYAKLDYSNIYTGENEFFNSTFFSNGYAAFRGDALGGFYVNYDDSATASYHTLRFPHVRNTNTDVVAYRRYVDSLSAIKLDTSASYLKTIAVNSDALYNAASFAYSNYHVGTITQNLATQTSYKLFGTGSSSATPTFQSSIDSNWIPALHSENYFNTKYYGGTIATNYVSKASGTKTLTASSIYDDGTNVGIGTASGFSTEKLLVSGAIRTTGALSDITSSRNLVANSNVNAPQINALLSGTNTLSLFGVTGFGVISAPSTYGIRFSTNNSIVGYWTSGGNLGIGTSSTPADKLTVTGNLNLNTAGNKIIIATGTNASVGVSGAMTAGTITISTTAVTSSSKIFLTHASLGGIQGILSVGTIVNATSFVINSSSMTDTGTINWWIVN